MSAITRFAAEYRWLSNFALAVVQLDGVSYPTVEHAYQAAKTLDISERNQISSCASPGEAKRAGRHVTLRGDCESVKVSVMRELLRQKFSIPKYALLLTATGDAMLIEGNNWGDTFWGICRGEGQNRLGRLLMSIRHELIEEFNA